MKHFNVQTLSLSSLGGRSHTVLIMHRIIKATFPVLSFPASPEVLMRLESQGYAPAQPDTTRGTSSPSWVWGSAAVGGTVPASPGRGAKHQAGHGKCHLLYRAYQFITKHGPPRRAEVTLEASSNCNIKQTPPKSPQNWSSAQLLCPASSQRVSDGPKPTSLWTECPGVHPACPPGHPFISTRKRRHISPPIEKDIGVRGLLQVTRPACGRDGTQIPV